MTTGSWRTLQISVTALIVVAAIGLWYSARGPHDEFATLSGHTDGVFSLALSPDGTTVASGDGDGTVRLWDVAGQREKFVLRGHEGRVQGLAWSPSGDTLVTGGADKSMRLWDANTGKEIAVWPTLPRQVRVLALSRDGQTLAAALDTDISYWKIDNRRERQLLRGHLRPIAGMVFLREGLELASFASDGTVRIWDLAAGRELAKMPGPVGHCYGMSVSGDGKIIACVGGARVHLYDAEKRVPLDSVEPHTRILCGAALSPDGRTLAIGTQEKVVIIWNIPGKKEVARLNGHKFAVGPMAFLADGKTLITSSHDSTLKLWKVN
jgi:WD40 repeat protein